MGSIEVDPLIAPVLINGGAPSGPPEPPTFRTQSPPISLVPSSSVSTSDLSTSGIVLAGTTPSSTAATTPAARFVDALYVDSLGRTPTTSELAFWTRVDHRFGGGFVTRQIDNSAEHRLFVAQGSPTVIPRGPDLGSTVFGLPLFGGLTPLASNPSTTSPVAATLTPATTARPSTVAAFVDSLYTGVLHRPADASAEAFWVNLLDDGVSRATVRNAFATSAEALA